MRTLRRYLAGILLAAGALGMMGASPPTAEAAVVEPIAAQCGLDAGWYLMYDENNELVGIMYVYGDCSARVWLAQ